MVCRAMAGRQRAPLGLLAVALSGLSGPAAASSLTCAEFRDRFEGALVATAIADKNAELPSFQLSRETDGGGRYFSWTTSDLTGSLSCGPGDAFQEFYVNREVVARQQFVEQISHLVAINGGAICTVVSTSPVGCVDASKRMLQEAVQQMGVGLNRHIVNPNGISRVVLRGDLTAELTAAPTLITFSLAAKDGATVDAARILPPAAPAPAAAP